MAEKKEFKTQPTKSRFKIQGIVTNLDSNDKAYIDVDDEKVYRRLSFGVKTSPNNTVYVSLFGMPREKVRASKWNQQEKKWENKEVSWENRNKLPKGYSLNGFDVTKIGLERDGDKLKYVSLVNYDACEEIYNKLEDGMSVSVSGTIDYSEYNGRVNQQFNITYIALRKEPIDFDAEDFKEVAFFSQEVAFLDAQDNEVDQKGEIVGRTIKYGDKFTDFTFAINVAEDPALKQLYKNVKKFAKFGNVLKLEGKIVNKIEVEEQEVEVDDNSIANMFGGIRTGAFERQTIQRFVREMAVTYIEPVLDENGEMLTYTEEDFIVEEEEVKEKPQNKNNPFATGESKFDMKNLFDEEEDDPFKDPFA